MVEYRKQAHATYHTRYHLVFVTKYRRKILKQGMGSYLVKLLGAVEAQCPDVEILEMKTDTDHIHILAIIPPKRAVSDIVRTLKCNTSRMMKQRFPFLNTMYDQDQMSLWSDGYFVSTVGCDEATIQRYIQRQGQEDKGQVKLAL